MNRTVSRWPIPLLAGALSVACGARTPLSEGDDPERGDTPIPAEDSGRAGGERIDTGRSDAGDAGPPAECRNDTDCRGLICRAPHALVADDLARLPLECGEASPGIPVGGACDTREDCGRGICVLAGSCARPCVGDRDCDDGESCHAMWVVTASNAMQSVDGCAPDIVTPDAVTARGPESGPTLAAFETGVDSPGDLRPDALVIWRGPPTMYPTIETIRDRDGTPLFSVWDVGFGTSPDWGVAGPTISNLATLLYPNGPRTPRARRGTTVELIAETGGPTDRWVLSRDGTAGTSFDIDAFIVGPRRWTVRPGAPPRQLARALDEAREIMRAAGLEIGEVRVHEVVGGLRDRYAILDGRVGPFEAPDDLDDMFRLSAGIRRPSVSVFFVREMELALGTASGIPGPHTLMGSGASGVAIAADLIPPELLAGVVMHEVGHFMGLFHTTEADASLHDPMTDTEECPLANDTNGDFFLEPWECVGAGGDLLMFWAGQETRITPQQAELMRRAYFVY